jgi:hypothetical protein
MVKLRLKVREECFQSDSIKHQGFSPGTRTVH